MPPAGHTGVAPRSGFMAEIVSPEKLIDRLFVFQACAALQIVCMLDRHVFFAESAAEERYNGSATFICVRIMRTTVSTSTRVKPRRRRLARSLILVLSMSGC